MSDWERLTNATFDQSTTLYQKAACAVYISQEQSSLLCTVATISDYEIDLANIAYHVDLNDQLRELWHETQEDIQSMFRLFAYPIGLSIGLPRRIVPATCSEKIATLDRALESLSIAENEPDSRPTVFYSRAIVDAERRLNDEHAADFVAFQECYASYEHNTEATNKAIERMRQYTRASCMDKAEDYYNEILEEEKRIVMKRHDDRTKDVDEWFEQAKSTTPTSSQLHARRNCYRCPRFKPIYQTDDYREWSKQPVEYACSYDNDRLGNRLWRTVQNLRITGREIETDYKKVLWWSKQLFVETYDWDVSSPAPHRVKKNVPTYMQLYNDIKHAWDGERIGLTFDAVPPAFTRMLQTVHQITRTFGYTVQYAIKMIAQLLAPVVMLPLILVVRCLSFLFKELYYKLIYDDLGDGPMNGVLPPLEMFVSFVALGLRIMTMLFRPVKLGTRAIAHALKRIQQECSVLFRTILKPIVRKPSLFNERNFLIQLIQLDDPNLPTQGAIPAIVDVLTRKSSRTPIVTDWR